MAHSYTLNAQGAIEGSATGYQRITTTGAYTGTFVKAKAVTAGTGAQGIEFTFKADNGAEANYLNLYTHNAAGEETYGRKQLDNLMACLKRRQIAPQIGQIMEWDNDQGRELAVNAELYPELMNQRVGVVLQRDEYIKKDGSVGESMNLYSFFDADTRQNGAEIIQQAPATALDALLQSLTDKTVKKPATAAARQQQRSGAVAANSAEVKDFDDDLPF